MKKKCFIIIMLIAILSVFNAERTFAWSWNRVSTQRTGRVPKKVLVEKTVSLDCSCQLQNELGGRWYNFSSMTTGAEYKREVVDGEDNIIDEIVFYVEANYKDNCRFWFEDEGRGRGEIIKSISLWTRSENYSDYMKSIRITPADYPRGVIKLRCGKYAVAEVEVIDIVEGYLGSPPSRNSPIWNMVYIRVCIKQGEFE